jgi:hypothetical protein
MENDKNDQNDQPAGSVRGGQLYYGAGGLTLTIIVIFILRRLLGLMQQLAGYESRAYERRFGASPS